VGKNYVISLERVLNQRGIRNLSTGLFILVGGKFVTGQFAIVGILLIIIDFVPLAVGLGKSKGNFQSKFIKIAVPIWLVMLVLGIILIIIP
jgi:uncharacterized membrane protein YozB (DUF420 family)